MKTKKKDGAKKKTKPGRKPRSKAVSNLGATIKRGLDRVTGEAAPLVPYVGTSHEQLRQIMTRFSPEPAGSAPGAYTKPVRW